MKIVLLIASLLFFAMITHAQTAEEFAEIWDKQHISDILPSDVRHRDLQKYLEKLKKLGVKVGEVGRSHQNREIYQIEWGKGKTKVFMWSQMHGDEPTATSGLVDMFAFLQKNRDRIAWVKKLEETLTIRAVPMLNPDGAEAFKRRGAQDIDINRDAVNLATPEGRLLKSLRDEWKPEIGFNLHNQNPLTTVGETGKQATISFLAVSGNAKGEIYPAHERNKRICSLMTKALEKFIPGHIGRYEDEYMPTAFGDRISEWGTPVILIETGALHGRDEMFLVKLNFIANLTALQSLTDGERAADALIYENTPFNESGKLHNFIFRQANVIIPNGRETIFPGDIGVNLERRRASIPAPATIQKIGVSKDVKALEEFDVGEFYLVPKSGELKTGAAGDFLFYKKTRKIDWKTPDFWKKHKPDAIFENGKWVKGNDLFPKKLN